MWPARVVLTVLLVSQFERKLTEEKSACLHMMRTSFAIRSVLLQSHMRPVSILSSLSKSLELYRIAPLAKPHRLENVLRETKDDSMDGAGFEKGKDDPIGVEFSDNLKLED